ncbi:MAG TPA: hypothetical protein VII56_07610 [Rhizomicrobium sp.]
MSALVGQGLVPSYPRSKSIRIAVALIALALAIGVIFIVIGTAPLIGFDRDWNFAGRLGLVAFVAVSLIVLVTYRASCAKGK